MCGCALIEYNNHAARLRGVVLPCDTELVKFALNRWASLAFNLRKTDEKYIRMDVGDWIESIKATVNPSPSRDLVINALSRCRPEAF